VSVSHQSLETIKEAHLLPSDHAMCNVNGNSKSSEAENLAILKVNNC